ncbi:MAG TPA: TonB-dependent receptor [Prolixibacteraceae bacterium]|nr:TonB-dependent receptor [Prolixibacteraceae bacterium]
MKNSIMIFALMSAFHTSPAQEKPYSVKDTIPIREVIVTGTLTQINRNNTPLAVSVLDRRQIADGNESAILPLLSGRVPGLFVTERGVTGFGVATGSAGQITIRGVGGNPTTGVLMLIDGHPQFMGIMGHPLPDTYVTSDVEKVEVIRGPASILYGSNAMGGVINIITKKESAEGIGGNARLSYGSYNTHKEAASVGLKKKKFSSYASFNHDKTDGHRPSSDFEIVNGYLKFGYEINEHLKATTDFSIAKFNAQDPGPDTLNAKPGNRIDITRGYWAMSVSNDYDKLSGAIKLYNNFGEHTISDGFHSTDNNNGINLYQTLKIMEGSNLSFGADLARYGGKAENTKAMNGKGITFADTTVNEAGVYAFMQQTLFHYLTVTGGIRLQNHSKYGSEWIPSAGFAWQIAAQTTWRTNFSKGFRSPTIRELYMFNHNPNLQPERIYSYETGIAQNFLENRLKVELTGYLLEGDNLIVTGAMGNLYNTGEIHNKGVELSFNARPVKNLEFILSYSYINMEKPLFATPKNNLFLSGTYRWEKFRINASFQNISDLNNDATGKVNLVSYSLLNAKAAWNVNRHLEFTLSGENLLGQKYEPNRYYPMPLTTVFAGVNIQFGRM